MASCGLEWQERFDEDGRVEEVQDMVCFGRKGKECCGIVGRGEDSMVRLKGIDILKNM